MVRRRVVEIHPEFVGFS